MLLPLAISFILKADDFQNDNVQPRLHASPLDSHIQLSTWHLHSDIWQPRLHMSTAQLLIPSYPPSLICSSLSLLHLTQWQFYHSIFLGQKSLKFYLILSFSLHTTSLSTSVNPVGSTFINISRIWTLLTTSMAPWWSVSVLLHLYYCRM